MCGRYVLTDLEKFLQRQKWIRRPDPTLIPPPRYNVAPQQDIVAVIRDKQEAGHGVIKPFRWGLVPSWAKDETTGFRMINARRETLGERGSFARALERRRCLIPADAFYEWKKPAGRGARKQPHAIRRKNDEPFAFAGLWDVWHDRSDPSRDPLFTCTIITCPPNALVADLHDRMPVILPESRYHDWLEVDRVKGADAAKLLEPYPADDMYAYPVDRRVGNADNEGPELIKPQEEAEAKAKKGREPDESPSLF